MLQEFKDCLRLAAQDLGHGIVDASGEAEVSDEHRARLSESVATLGRLNVLVGGPALLQKRHLCGGVQGDGVVAGLLLHEADAAADRKSTRLNSSHQKISYAVFCLKKKKTK